MTSITEPEHEIPVLMQADVVVAGGGPSGFAASVAAARNGARTILVEKNNFVGGLLSCLPMNSFCNYQGKQVIYGIAQELVNQLIDIGACPGHIVDARLGSITVTDGEQVKIVTQRIIEKAGVHLFFHTLVAAPFMDGNAIRGIIVENKSGRQAILGKVVIDATGDGDVAARAGAPYEIKDRKNMQPGTLVFKMDNVNVDKLRLAIARNPGSVHLPGFHLQPQYYLKAKRFIFDGFMDLMREAKRKGDFPPDYPMDWAIVVTQPRKDEVLINMAMVTGFHSTDAGDLTRAEMQGRKRIPVVVRFLKKYVAGFEKAHLVTSHDIIGVRESRRFIGEYVLTNQDVMNNRTFDDGISVAPWKPSVGHHPSGRQVETGPSRDKIRGCEVPYRCLVPKKIESLLLAGRCVSVDGMAQNAIRNMPPCMALGQAAGSAAALAVKDGISPRSVDTAKLRKVLVEQGVYLLGRSR